MTPEDLIQRFHLAPLTGEGGLYRRTYCSARELPAEAFGPQYPAGTRKAAGSAIEYLITPQSYSRLHRLPTDEVYHFYLGDPVEMLQLYPDGTGKVVRMGQDILHGEELQLTVPRGTWQGTRLVPGGQWALLGTSMAPGMEFHDYEDGDQELLIKQYPQFRDLLEHLAGGPIYES